jgi:3-oxoacyl-[acyl-carrier-protein] synthase-3
MKRPSVFLAGTGFHAPSRVVTNHDFAELGIETTHEWIFERSGIVERRIAAAEETTCDMAAAASLRAMSEAGVGPGEVDLIVFSTATPDRLLPATAVDLQAVLGTEHAAAFDISAACSGWLYALTVAEGMIASGSAHVALVVGAEKMSSIIDWKDRSTCVLFGDAAGAAIVRKSTGKKGILSSFIRSDGRLAELLYRPSGGAKTPMSAEVLADRSHLVYMAGREVFKAAVRSMADAADRALEQAGLTASDVDLLIPHQANIRIIEATARHSGIPMEKVFVNVDRFGNTSSASIPIALHEAKEQGRVSEGSTVLLVAFGAGFTWASMVVRF